MQKLCLAIVLTLFVVIVIINISASGLYLPTEWNFNYTSTYEKFIVNLVVTSASDSTVRKQCQQDWRCMALMHRNNIAIT